MTARSCRWARHGGCEPMAWLALLWAYALVLVAISIAGMTTLILRRIMRECADARRSRNRQALIVALLAPNVEPSGRAASLIALDGETAAETLLEVLTLVRGSDRERIIETAKEKGAPAILRKQLANGCVRRRILAAEALGFFPGPQTLRALRQAEHDGDARVQVAALKSMVELGAPSVIEHLLARMPSEGGRRLSSLVGVLRMAVASKPDEAISALSCPGLPTPVRIALIDSLAATHANEGIDVIAALTNDDNLEIRAAAIQALGLLAHPSCAPIIAKALGDQDWRIRLKAAEAAGRLGLVDFSEPLCALLADKIWWVRFRASEALAALGEKGIAALRTAASVGQDSAGRTAALALLERAAA